VVILAYFSYAFILNTYLTVPVQGRLAVHTGICWSHSCDYSTIVFAGFGPCVVFCFISSIGNIRANQEVQMGGIMNLSVPGMRGTPYLAKEVLVFMCDFSALSYCSLSPGHLLSQTSCNFALGI
jgi:hypothetical protein